MKDKSSIELLLFLLIMGLLYGLVFHLIVMPFFGSQLIHCVTTGIIFGIINYLIVLKVHSRNKKLEVINEDLEEKINIDRLTALLNRRAFDNDINELTKNDCFSIIFIDIDNFKEFNDRFGHNIGDMVLAKVAKTVNNSVRGSDKVYRYGGEELVVILKECEKVDTIKIAEKIRCAIAQLDNEPYPSITISLGIASSHIDGLNAKEVIMASDKALIKAKQQGKNCCVAF